MIFNWLFLEYFSNLFLEKLVFFFDGPEFQMNSLPNSLCEGLWMLPSEIETFQVVQDIMAWKSPGPNGIPVGFFQKLWPIIEHDVVQLIQDLFLGRKIFKISMLPIFICYRRENQSNIHQTFGGLVYAMCHKKSCQRSFRIAWQKFFLFLLMGIKKVLLWITRWLTKLL